MAYLRNIEIYYLNKQYAYTEVRFFVLCITTKLCPKIVLFYWDETLKKNVIPSPNPFFFFKKKKMKQRCHLFFPISRTIWDESTMLYEYNKPTHTGTHLIKQIDNTPNATLTKRKSMQQGWEPPQVTGSGNLTSGEFHSAMPMSGNHP